MPALIDLALTLLVLVGAFFLGSVTVALIKEMRKKDQ